jgi:hypothetical protein
LCNDGKLANVCQHHCLDNEFHTNQLRNENAGWIILEENNSLIFIALISNEKYLSLV